jgi:ubiquitin-protein ligase
MDPRELRKRRLDSEHKELMRLNGSVIKIEPIGNAPHEKYTITFNIRTFISARPTYRNSTVCTLEIPLRYPHEAPTLVSVSSPPPYHVNWFTSSRWCYGSWNPEEPLVNYVLRAARTLRNDPELVNVNSPANSSAISFWEANKNNKHMVPCDTKTLPVLSTPGTIDILERPRSGTIDIIERPKSGTITINQVEKPQISILPKNDD